MRVFPELGCLIPVLTKQRQLFFFDREEGREVAVVVVELGELCEQFFLPLGGGDQSADHMQIAAVLNVADAAGLLVVPEVFVVRLGDQI